MKNQMVYTASFIAILVSFFSSATCFADDLEYRWRQEVVEPGITLSHRTLKKIKKRKVVFVTGSFNEFSPGALSSTSAWRLYFGNNIAAVQKDLRARAEIFNPDTFTKDIVKNAEVLNLKLQKNFELDRRRKIDVIAHSRGGGVALYAFLKYPEFRRIVEHLVLIQSSIGGAVDGMFYESHKSIFDFFSFITRGLRDQSPIVSQDLFNRVYQEFESQIGSEQEYRKFSDRIYYVRGSQDTVVPLEMQSFSKIGTALDPLPVKHIDLVVWWLGLRSNLQKAFTRAIFGLIYDRDQELK